MIVENVEYRSQTRLGKLTPKARQEDFTSAFAVVEGNSPSGWHTKADYEDGIEFGESGEKKIRFHEFKTPDGKTNDVVFNGLKLREMVCEREHTDAKNRYEGEISRVRTAAIEGWQNTSPDAGISRTDNTTMIDVANVQAPPEAMAAAYGTRPTSTAAAKRPHWRTVQKAKAAAASQSPQPTTQT